MSADIDMRALRSTVEEHRQLIEEMERVLLSMWPSLTREEQRDKAFSLVQEKARLERSLTTYDSLKRVIQKEEAIKVRTPTQTIIAGIGLTAVVSYIVLKLTGVL